MGDVAIEAVVEVMVEVGLSKPALMNEITECM